MKNNWKIFGNVLIISSIIPFFMGLHKMYFYDSGEYSYSKAVNAYVGGDAYNYIINSNYATGFFVLAVGFLIAGLICILIANNNKGIQLQQEQSRIFTEINLVLKNVRDYQQKDVIEDKYLKEDKTNE